MIDESKWDAAKRKYEAAESVTDRVLHWVFDSGYSLIVVVASAVAIIVFTVWIS